MKKLILSLIVIASFLLGNISMVLSIIKIFGEDALIPVVKDLIYRKVETVLWGNEIPRGKPVSLKTAYTGQGDFPYPRRGDDGKHREA